MKSMFTFKQVNEKKNGLNKPVNKGFYLMQRENVFKRLDRINDEINELCSLFKIKKTRLWTRTKYKEYKKYLEDNNRKYLLWKHACKSF